MFLDSRGLLLDECYTWCATAVRDYAGVLYQGCSVFPVTSCEMDEVWCGGSLLVDFACWVTCIRHTLSGLYPRVWRFSGYGLLSLLMRKTCAVYL